MGRIMPKASPWVQLLLNRSIVTFSVRRFPSVPDERMEATAFQGGL